jgi:hypothetical protein
MQSQKKALIFGGILGSLLGVVAAWLYIRTEEKRKGVSPGEALKLSISILRLLRQISTLGLQGTTD